MISKLKIFAGLLICSTVFYSACKKSSSTSSDPALTPSQVADAVAVNISGSLFGSTGAFDVSEGLNAPTEFAVKGKVLQDTDPECGLAVDTTVSVTSSGDGETASVSGTLKFNFGCTNGVVTSYTTSDNVSISLKTSSLDFTYKVGEAFTLALTNVADPTSNLSLTGTLGSSGSYQLLTGNKGAGTQVFNYTLNSLIISQNGAGIVSGSASFTTSGTGPQGVWSYSGTITFNNNQTATVTISGKAYTVNLATGA
jgi:hypothetical protein